MWVICMWIRLRWWSAGIWFSMKNLFIRLHTVSFFVCHIAQLFLYVYGSSKRSSLQFVVWSIDLLMVPIHLKESVCFVSWIRKHRLWSVFVSFKWTGLLKLFGSASGYSGYVVCFWFTKLSSSYEQFCSWISLHWLCFMFSNHFKESVQDSFLLWQYWSHQV